MEILSVTFNRQLFEPTIETQSADYAVLLRTEKTARQLNRFSYL